jgi:hypothetical protein
MLRMYHQALRLPHQPAPRPLLRQSGGDPPDAPSVFFVGTAFVDAPQQFLFQVVSASSCVLETRVLSQTNTMY